MTPARGALAVRGYRITSLLADGQVRTTMQTGPAVPVFESAFSAFAHGTLINTTRGQVAVEDLVPGMKLVTADRTPEQLLWIGAVALVPQPDGPRCGLTRIMAGNFGIARPQTDLMAGPGARLLIRPSGLAERFGSDRVLTPASQVADGVNAIAIVPPHPVTLYHLCLRRHAVISAAGMEAESYHPGRGFERAMGANMLSLFLSFFPHVGAAQDFGPLAHPRLPFDHEEETVRSA